ncbi:MAG: hypothetical protein ACXWEY_16300 [Bacteroidia bacterium]
MKLFRIVSLLIFLGLVFNACVNEADEPPGCNTPDMPTLNVQGTEFTEGEDIVLNAEAPAGVENGAFEWQGPNRYFISQQQLVIKNAKQVNEGEYKVFYLNKGRCRSKPASVFVTVYTFLENCGLSKNIIRKDGNDISISNVRGNTETSGNYSVTGSSDSIQVKIIFPGKERPATGGTYFVTPNSGSQLAPNELDILININGQSFYATQGANKTVKVFYHDTDLHIAFCSYNFGNNTGNTLILSGNIVVP